MSTISGVSANGGSDPWAAMKAQRSQMQAKMFAKVDTDSNGSVNPSELGTMLDTIGQKTGATFDDAAKVLTAMDSNADGSLSSDELGEGMKNLMPPPPPSSTMDFAQTRSSSASTGSANDDLFSKVDSDGSGGVSNDELQALFDKMASDGGVSKTSDSTASDLFNQLDTDGDGALTQTEFDAGRPQGPHGNQGVQGGGGMPPPPPGGGGGPAGAGGSSASSSASTTYDPLDTNQDGTVSLAERLAGSTKSDPVQALFKAMDTNSDGEVNKTETDAFAQKLSDLVAQSTNHSESTASGKTANQGFDVARMAQMLYDQVAGGLSSASQSSTLSTVA